MSDRFEDLTLYKHPTASQRGRQSFRGLENAQTALSRIMSVYNEQSPRGRTPAALEADMSRIQRRLHAYHKQRAVRDIGVEDLSESYQVNLEDYGSFRNTDEEFYRLQIRYYEQLKRNMVYKEMKPDVAGKTLEIAVNDDLCLSIVQTRFQDGVLSFFDLLSGQTLFFVDIGEYYYVIINRQIAYAQLGKQLRDEDHALIIEQFGSRVLALCDDELFHALTSLL